MTLRMMNRSKSYSPSESVLHAGVLFRWIVDALIYELLTMKNDFNFQLTHYPNHQPHKAMESQINLPLHRLLWVGHGRSRACPIFKAPTKQSKSETSFPVEEYVQG